MTLRRKKGIISLAVSLMTVLIEDTATPSCPPAQLDKMGGVPMVTVVDRSTELSLLDDDSSTCLSAFEHGRQYFHLMAYIYVPFSNPLVRVVIVVSGLPCSVPDLFVYHQVSMAVRHKDIHYQECGLIETRDVVGSMQQCEYVCYQISPDASVVKVGIRAENLPWQFNGSGKVCGMTAVNDWNSLQESVENIKYM